MTPKEAIEELKKVDTIDMPARLCEAHYMAIKALEQESCGDVISREAVLSLPRNRTYQLTGLCKNESIDVDLIEALPSVTPQEPKTDVLDKIKTEIAEYKDDKIIHDERNEMIDIVLDIIDKYKAESEVLGSD